MESEDIIDRQSHSYFPEQKWQGVKEHKDNYLKEGNSKFSAIKYIHSEFSWYKLQFTALKTAQSILAENVTSTQGFQFDDIFVVLVSPNLKKNFSLC